MELKSQLLFAMALFFAPIAIDLAVAAARRSRRYRLNDLLANSTLSVLTVLGSALISGLTGWLYIQVHGAFALFALPAGALTTWLVGFIAYDVLYYWAHRAHHTVAWLWGVHVVHHSGEDMNFGLAVRQSALGGLTTWFFFLPMALVGVPSEVYLGVAGLQLLYQYFIHNTYVPALGPVEKILVTPSQHRVHHARNLLYLDRNYGNILVVWDRLFGTYQPEVAEYRPVYGLRHGARTWNPITLHLQGFAELFRKAAACRRPLDRLLCLIKGPGWDPPSLDAGRFAAADDGPSASFRRYDPQLPRSVAAYCVAQFLALTAAVVLLLWNLDAMSAASASLCCGLVVLSAWSLGGLLDGKPIYWRLEVGRLAAVALLGSAVAIQEGLSPTGVLLPMLLYSAASLAYLARFHSGFLAGASASTSPADASPSPASRTSAGGRA